MLSLSFAIHLPHKPFKGRVANVYLYILQRALLTCIDTFFNNLVKLRDTI